MILASGKEDGPGRNQWPLPPVVSHPRRVIAGGNGNDLDEILQYLLNKSTDGGQLDVLQFEERRLIFAMSILIRQSVYHAGFAGDDPEIRGATVRLPQPTPPLNWPFAPMHTHTADPNRTIPSIDPGMSGMIPTRKRVSFIPQNIAVVTLSSPESSPSTSTSDGPLPKRSKQLTRQFEPPIPDAVEIPPRFDATVRLDCIANFQLAQINPHCNCNANGHRMVGGLQVACRCGPMVGPPVPTVRIHATSRTFELLDIKWCLRLEEMHPTPVNSNQVRTGIVFLPIPLEGELPADAEIDVTGTITLLGPTTYSMERKVSFELGAHKFRHRNQYYMPLDKQHLNQMCLQPMGTMNFQYPSSMSFSIQLHLVVTDYKNLKKPPRITLEFEQPKSLSNFVIMCGTRPLYADLQYLIHYSNYFECIARYTEGASIHSESGFKMVTCQEDDFDPWKAILLYISPCRTPLPNKLLVDILRLCDQFFFLTVKNEAERMLIRLLGVKEGSCFSDLEYLTIAETYNLHQLKEHAVTSLFRLHHNGPVGVNLFQYFTQVIQNDKHYPNLRDETKVFLLDRMRSFGSGQVLPPAPITSS